MWGTPHAPHPQLRMSSPLRDPGPLSAVRARGRRGGPREAPAGHPGQAGQAAAPEGHQVGRGLGEGRGAERDL